MDRRNFLKAAATVTGSAALSTGLTVPRASAASGGRGVLSGIENLARDGYRLVGGQRVGLISNPTGIIPDLRHDIDLIVDSGQVDLVAAFGPEHGFRGSAQAGGSEGDYEDPRTGVPVYDTYQKSPAQIADFFRAADVETVMFDIQDVGARFYTFIWTMYDCMVAASLAGVRFVVLDRPNPITGLTAYGPVLHPEQATFVGRKPISQQHGMTVGELAGLFNGEFLPVDANANGPVELAVSELTGWHRDTFYEDTGQPWVMPSPNMPRVDTAVVYPGTCLFEATNLSEGRGTTRPFELIGAPYIDFPWADALQDQGLAGVEFREAYFVPTGSKHVGKTCGGVQLHVTDREEYDAIRTALAMIIAAKQLFPDFTWREQSPPFWIDRLSGSEWVRTAIDGGANVDDVVAGWQDELGDFRATRRQYLLYSGRRNEDG
ncbi:MAG: exo-beta-N-acetylmuramidase NamZ family protein [Nocardioidaceae bacterium]